MKKFFATFSLVLLGSSINASWFSKPETRKTEYTVNKIFTDRWSSRAMSGEQMSDKELRTLFEAAKWAPSSFNSQPWVLHYAKRGTKGWDKLFGLMVEFNQLWAKDAAALVVIVSKNTHDGNPSRTHSFDTGAAWQNLALQGSMNGFVVHGMSGFDFGKAKTALNLSDDYTVEAMAAIGKPGSKTRLPEGLQKMEAKKSDRNKQEQFVFEVN